jgi:hypothetical protein
MPPIKTTKSGIAISTPMVHLIDGKTRNDYGDRKPARENGGYRP